MVWTDGSAGNLDRHDEDFSLVVSKVDAGIILTSA